MRIVVDENIAFAEEAFASFGEVELYPGREITNEILMSADILVVRSVTTVNETLLKGTKIKFVGTATIGWDHLDISYLKKNNIFYTSAAGCNSDAVAEYIFAAIYDIAGRRDITLKGKKMGIIGAGNIGGKVAQIASTQGLEVILNDPPLARKTGSPLYHPLQELYDSDILTLHVPLNTEGEDSTYHLFNKDNLKRLNDNIIILNTSRGAVIDNDILPHYIKKKGLITVLDVWENEPMLNKDLLSVTETATPHVAGYSVEGKINGTVMIYNALCRFIGYDPGWKYILPEPESTIITPVIEESVEKQIDQVIKSVYNIRRDDSEMRKALEMENRYIPAFFDLLRKKYTLRKEYRNYIVSSNDQSILNRLRGMGFGMIST
jgi:erythronate-4-phosphate dehydrogenase